MKKYNEWKFGLYLCSNGATGDRHEPYYPSHSLLGQELLSL